MPPLHWLGGWSEILALGSSCTGFLCAYYWCLPFASPLGRAASFAVCLAYFYLSHVVFSVGPWYLPSITLLCIIVLGQMLRHAIEVAGRAKKYQARVSSSAKTVLYATGVSFVLISTFLTAAVAYEMKLQQDIIENGNRKKIGYWLREHAASPNETVFLECLGYIGYYSGMKMLDYPGLSSPEMVEARARLHTDNFAALIWTLQPEWLVLRPHEAEAVQETLPSLLHEQYEEAAVFDVTETLNSYPAVPGRQLLEWDRTFIVYRSRSVN
jgi:hypothetical protein